MHDQNRVFVSPYGLSNALSTATREEAADLYENNADLIERWPWLKAEFEEAQSVGGGVEEIRERHKVKADLGHEGEGGYIHDLNHTENQF